MKVKNRIWYIENFSLYFDWFEPTKLKLIIVTENLKWPTSKSGSIESVTTKVWAHCWSLMNRAELSRRDTKLHRHLPHRTSLIMWLIWPWRQEVWCVTSIPSTKWHFSECVPAERRSSSPLTSTFSSSSSRRPTKRRSDYTEWELKGDVRMPHRSQLV